MYISKEIKDKKDFKIDGSFRKLIIPENTTVEEKYNINFEDNKIEFNKGENSYLLTKLIGIKENVNFTVFFVEDIMVIKLNKGCLYLKEDENIFSFNTESILTNNEATKICWKKTIEIREYIKDILRNRIEFEEMNKIEQNSTKNKEENKFLKYSELKKNVEEILNKNLKESAFRLSSYYLDKESLYNLRLRASFKLGTNEPEIEEKELIEEIKEEKKQRTHRNSKSTKTENKKESFEQSSDEPDTEDINNIDLEKELEEEHIDQKDIADILADYFS